MDKARKFILGKINVFTVVCILFCRLHCRPERNAVFASLFVNNTFVKVIINKIVGGMDTLAGKVTVKMIIV